MRSEDVTRLREFIAAERGVPFEEISEAQVIARYRWRWLTFFLGFGFVCSIYFLLKLAPNTAFAEAFVFIVVMVGLTSQILRFRSSGHLSAGPRLSIRKEMAEELNVEPDRIGDALIQDYDRRNEKATLLGLLLAACAALGWDWFFPNIPLELFTVGTFYCTGVLAWRARHL